MLTEKNAKIVASFLATFFVVYYGFQYSTHGNATCQDLLTDGKYHSDGNWQPATCMMHHYSSKDSPSCLHESKIILIGDSRIRQLYYGILNVTGQKDINQTGGKHSDQKHVIEDVNAVIEFWWHPEVNDSTSLLFDKLLEMETPPCMIIFGVATWTIKLNLAVSEALLSYKANLTKMVPYFEKVAEKSKMVWMMQAPVTEGKLYESRQMITNKVVMSYNEAAEEVLHDAPGLNIWYSGSKLVEQYFGPVEEGFDGLHVPSNANLETSQILLNWFCNRHVKPRDTSCCTGDRPSPNIIQISCFVFFVLCLLATLYFYNAVRQRKMVSLDNSTGGESKEPNGIPIEVVVQATQKEGSGTDKDELLEELEYNLNVSWHLTKFGLIMTYFYICDRTDLFPKANKHFNLWHFAVPLLTFLLYGIWDHKKVKRPDILNVEQTTEWKGWMQLIILVYHFTGASKKIPIYMQLRDIVAAYFFLSGFSQFFVSWSREKFGLLRVCEVVFRYNFFVFFLCLVMDRQYQLYYFVPLITFWYFVIYITMAIYPRATKARAEENSFYYYVMIAKLAILVIVIFLLAYSQTFFYMLFGIPPVNELFQFPGTSLYEWWFRWQLDRYVVPFGMIFSFSLLTSKAKGWLDDSHADDLFSRKLSIMVTVAGLTLHAIHIARAFFCTDKPSCNRVHVYVSVIPILSVILFRNTIGILRSHYSVFFAWVGSMSLELFVGQYHVWLAEDTTGLLILVPGYPLINVAVTSFIFVCIALEIRDISGVVTVAAIPRVDKKNPGKAERAMMKRLLVFLILLLLFYGYKLVRDL